MIRADIISTIGREFLVSNIENDEYSYPKAYKAANLEFIPIRDRKGRKFEKLDIRFIKDGVTVLVETKTNFSQIDEEQLSAYVEYEKALTGNKIIAILANTENDNIKVWRGVVSDNSILNKEDAIREMHEYVDFYTSKINDKEKVMSNTYKLNKLLHKHGISEELRSQFVGTCLLSLKNGLKYNIATLTASQIRARIKETLEELLNYDINKAGKLALLEKNVLLSQDIRALKIESFREILKYIENNILPFINDKSTSGQDLLNLFFVTFNKYVKTNKNLAFTPDHITDFMTKISGVSKHSVILDPCCGSGSFLVRAMTQALEDCSTEKEQNEVKKHNIFGIEYDENIYGLATTNMLIHSDGNSNIIQGSCFDFKDWIQNAKPNVILMNPPYNAQRKHMPPHFVSKWSKDKKEDPTKGLYFVKYIADTLNSCNMQATLAVLLPVACAIGTSKEIENVKIDLLKSNTLDAVFTLPSDVFHPAAAPSACCMVFKIGKKHSDVTNPPTFFGYYKDDGFKKKKNLGRVEQKNSDGNSLWKNIEEKWIELYRDRHVVDGLSAVKKVSGNDEWLCEAYMKTDYDIITEALFRKTINEYMAYLIKFGKYPNAIYKSSSAQNLDVKTWEEFYILKTKDRAGLFTIENCKCGCAGDLEDGDDVNYIGAKKADNGVMKKVSSDKNLLSKGNGILFICDGEGSVGYTNYMDEDFIGSTTTSIGYNKNLNVYNALFLVTVLDQEKFKFSYGRKYRANLDKILIKLPVCRDSDGSPYIDATHEYSTKGYVPDFKYMENYIKALPYGDRL